MAEIERTTIACFDEEGNPVPNRIVRLAGAPTGLAIVAPGMSYTCDNPLLYYTTLLLAWRGYEVLQIWFEYGKLEFRTLPMPEQVRRVTAHTQAAVETLIANRPDLPLILAGKSLGTLALSALIGRWNATHIWLTPLLTLPGQVRAARQSKNPVLLVGGTADGFFDRTALQSLRASTRVEILVLEGADHGLDIPGDPLSSVQVLQKTMDNMDSFLQRHPERRLPVKISRRA